MNLNMIMKINGTNKVSSIKEIKMKKYQEQYNHILKEKFSYFNMIIGTDRATKVIKDLDVKNETKIIFDFNKSKGKTDLKPLQKKILFANNDLHVGSCIAVEKNNSLKTIKSNKIIHNINFANFNKYQHFLLSKCDETYEDHSIGYVTECNHFINIPYRENEYILFPCYIESATLYSDGLNQNKDIVFSDDEIAVYVPINDITKNIKIGQRFIFANEFAFFVTLFDVWSSAKSDYVNGRQGLLKIHMAREEKRNEMDDLKNNIADNSDLFNKTNNNTLSEAKIKGNNEIKLGRINIWKYEDTDEITWEIKDDYGLVQIKENYNNKIKLYAIDKENNINKQFKILIKNKNGKVLEEKTITIKPII